MSSFYVIKFLHSTMYTDCIDTFVGSRTGKWYCIFCTILLAAVSSLGALMLLKIHNPMQEPHGLRPFWQKFAILIPKNIRTCSAKQYQAGSCMWFAIKLWLVVTTG